MHAAFDPDWFDRYLEAFAACGRGESDDLESLLEYYDVPLLLSSDAAAVTLATAEQVLGFVRSQVETMRADRYDRSETLASEAVALNRTCALHTAEFSRHRRDGTEIGRFRATYLITTGESGRRLSALVLHSA